MNMNMNINSLLANMSAINNSMMNNGDNKLNKNKGINSFITILNKAMQQDNSLVEGSMSEPDLFSSIAGLLSENNNITIDNDYKSNNSHINLLEELTKDKAITDIEMVDYSNILSMLSGLEYNNIFNPEPNDFTEAAARNILQGIQQKNDLNIQKYSPGITKAPFSFTNIESSDNKAVNSYQFLMSHMNSQGKNIDKPDMEPVPSMMMAKESKLNILKEAVFNEADNSMERLKREIDTSRMIVQNKKSVFSDNKIIEVSNEASKIKGSIISQVKDKILLAAKDKDGTQSITMELFPKNLGKVDIKLSIEAKKVTVEIFAANKEVGQILMSNADQLAKTLHKSSGSYVDVMVSNNSLMSQYENSNLNYSSNQEERQRYGNNYGIVNSHEKSDEDNTVIEMLNIRSILNRVV